MTFQIRPLLSIGVTGHRSLAAGDKVEAQLRAVFAAIVEALTAIEGDAIAEIPNPCRIRLISPRSD
jgi:hypothetical protein